MDFNMILDVLIMACGVYMVYWAIQMKREKKIPEMLVGKGFRIERAKDPEGFIKFTFPYTFATGVILFAAGLIEALEVITYTHPLINSLISFALVVVIIGYGVILMKAQKKISCRKH
jgi:threonine/homoserine/homoserine lactone efflux protein